MTWIDEFIMDDYEDNYGVYGILHEFEHDRDNGIDKKQWNLIPADQYKGLAKRLMSAPTPDAARIPDNVVTEWVELCAKNWIDLCHITDLAGHSSGFPIEDLNDMYGEDVCDFSDYGEASNFLEERGFYDWCSLPDGTDGWSDYGLEPIYDILKEYEPDMEPWEKFIIVNRIIDVTHQRGDLASAFIEGGSKTCADLSEIIDECVKIGNHYNVLMESDCDVDDYKIPQKSIRELFDEIDDAIERKGAFVSRFLSDANYITIRLTKSSNYDFGGVIRIMDDFGYYFYDNGECDNNIMLTFKKKSL